MVAVHSTMLPLGTLAPDFSLPDAVTGKNVSPADFAGKPALLVAFICNHCPFVVHIREPLAALIKEYQVRGLAAVAICSNDAEKYPEDSPSQMAVVARKLGFTFPYLFDENQEVARAYHAACTPDFYVFDAKRKLVYRGRFDAARPGRPEPVDGADLRAALEAALAGKSLPESAQKPSVGCNIKWKRGSEPPWFPA
ncbi:MAG TPA: thioredoxin family protein [Opitutales bacterium]|nr:thioredoxin family protein [Opitutales bacterium]